MHDPVEDIVAQALERAGIRFRHEEPHPHPDSNKRLDFYLPELDLFIEVKAFSSDRTAHQIRGLENVIVVQGEDAARVFARWIDPGGPEL